jgi:O-antigen/teichoic acid export membrane protein
LADCADDPGRLRAQVRRASRLIGLLLLGPAVITCLLAKEVLGIFGADYSHYSPLLILLLLSTVPDAVINVAVAILRVQGQLVVVAALTVAGAVMSTGGAWLLMPHLGIFGAGVAVFASQTIVAAAFAVMGSRGLFVTVRATADVDATASACAPADDSTPWMGRR